MHSRRLRNGGAPIALLALTVLAGFAPPGGADTTPADAALHQLSLVKDPDEVARIHHSYELCWVAQAADTSPYAWEKTAAVYSPSLASQGQW